LEMTPVVVGFSVGTLFIFLQRLVAALNQQQSSVTTPSQRSSSGGKTEEEEHAMRQPDGVQPRAAAEPGPEPLPRNERLPPVLLLRGQLRTVGQAVALCVVGLAIRFTMWGHDACAETGDCREVTDGMDAASITLPLVRQHHPIEVVNDVAFHRSAYWGKIAVGSPPVNFTVAFDTGSGNIVLPSAYCKTRTCRSRTRYKRSTSRSAIDINHDGALVQPGDERDHITVSYGTGEVSGVFVEEIVCFGPEGNATVANLDRSQLLQLPTGCVLMRIIVATFMSDDPFRDFKFDGVLGLGLQGLSQTPEFNFPTVMTNAFRQWGSLHPHMFAVYLGHSDEDQSEITLGGYNPRRVNGDLVWNKVVHPELGQWMIQIRSIRIDGEPLPYCKDGCRAISDTGTSLLTVPTAIFEELSHQLQHDAPPVGPCNREGPRLQFDLDGITLTLDPSDYAHRHNSTPSWKDDELSASVRGNVTHKNHADQCKPLLMVMDFQEPLGPRLFILGEPVLKKYYSVYSARDPPKIAFTNIHERTNGVV